MRKIDHSRRQFMKTASYAAMAGVTASPLLHSMRALAAMTSHAAAAATDYRAMVCVYLQGGNDGHGTLIATDPDSFSAFTQARSGARGARLSHEPAAADYAHYSAVGPYLCSESLSHRSTESLQRRPLCVGREHRNSDRAHHQGSVERRETLLCPGRCSRISIRPMPGRRSPPTAPTGDGEAAWPTCSRA